MTKSSTPGGTGLHPLLSQAVALHQAGRLEQAARMYETILSELPDQFDASHLLGVIAMQEGRLPDAQRQIKAALEIQPDHPSALINLTSAYLRDGQLELAAQYAAKVAGLLPESTDAMINYGTVLHQMGRFREATVPLEAAHRLNPRSTVICHLLGSCLLKTGDARKAVTVFEIATAVAPSDGDGWANLSAALNAVGEHSRAMECANRAVELSLDSSNALAAQAAAQFELGKVEESIVTYEQAVALNPTVPVLCGIARALITSGRPGDALTHLRQAIQIDGTNPFVRLLAAVSLLKPIYDSQSDLEGSRGAFELAMADLESWYSAAPVKDAYMAVGASQPFFVAYHPYNNRNLLSQYGAMCVSWMKTFPGAVVNVPDARARIGKFRVGIVSAHVRDHAVWNAILKGWVYQIDKSQFDIFLFSLEAQPDQETDGAQRQVQYFDNRTKSLADWVTAIRGANLDALIYDEIGMNPITLQLAAMRLAPLQAATWGHPETTGLPTMDFYLSSQGLEPPNAQDNYSEQLVLLPNMGVYVEALNPRSKDADLKMLGLPSGEPLLLCPGSPFKYSPLHDWVWIEIAKGLKAKGRGRLVFFSVSSGIMHMRLAARLRSAFAQVGLDFDSHVCVIPWLDRPLFFGLMKRAALVLDTLDFSGFNTAMQAIECGIPYLSFEGSFMRGRLASGLMRKLALPELVATTYEAFAQRAVSLAIDGDELHRLRGEIAKRRSTLFEDAVPIRALERFLAAETAKRRNRDTTV